MRDDRNPTDVYHAIKNIQSIYGCGIVEAADGVELRREYAQRVAERGSPGLRGVGAAPGSPDLNGHRERPVLPPGQ